MASCELPSGRRLGYELRGAADGAPLLLLAALGRDRTSWDFQVPALEPSMRCIVHDQEGTGESPPFAAGDSLSALAEDAAAIAAAVGVERLHVAGVSFGAAVAMTLALERPRLVESLALLTPWATCDRQLRMCFELIADLAEHAPTLAPAEAATMWLLLSRGAIDAAGDIGPEIEQRVASPAFPSRETLLRHLRLAIGSDLRDRLGEIRCPTLVVGGAEDKLVPVEHAHEVAAAIPAARLEVLEGEGATHGLPIEMAAELNQLLTDFYASERSEG